MIARREIGLIAVEAVATLLAGLAAAVLATIVVAGAVWALVQSGVGVHEYLAVMIVFGLMLVLLSAIEHVAKRWLV